MQGVAGMVCFAEKDMTDRINAKIPYAYYTFGVKRAIFLRIDTRSKKLLTFS